MLVLEKPMTSTREVQIIRWYEEVFPVACAFLKKRGGALEEAKVDLLLVTAGLGFGGGAGGGKKETEVVECT